MNLLLVKISYVTTTSQAMLIASFKKTKKKQLE
jgi:hypothetical protein